MTAPASDAPILVVDDQRELRLLVRLTLLPLGKVEAVASIDEALAYLAEKLPRLIVLDIWLGEGQSGLDLCRRIKAEHSAVKILLLSACGLQADVDIGMAAGADGYMVKPFSPKQLLATAQELLTSPDV